MNMKMVTIMLDDNLIKKIRYIQAQNITKSKKSVSFSDVINEIFKKVIIIYLQLTTYNDRYKTNIIDNSEINYQIDLEDNSELLKSKYGVDEL